MFVGCVQLLDECYFQDVEKIKTIGSSYMAASGLSPDREVSQSLPFVAWYPSFLFFPSSFFNLFLFSSFPSAFASAPPHALPWQECEDSWHHLSELVLFALSMQETLTHINANTGNNFLLRVGRGKEKNRDHPSTK